MNAIENFFDKNLVFSYQIIYSFSSLVLSLYLTKNVFHFLKGFLSICLKKGFTLLPKTKSWWNNIPIFIIYNISNK